LVKPFMSSEEEDILVGKTMHHPTEGDKGKKRRGKARVNVAGTSN